MYICIQYVYVYNAYICVYICNFDSQTWCHIQVEFFYWSSSLLWGFFSGSSSFPPSTKKQHFEIQSNLEIVGKKSELMECPLLNNLIPSLSLSLYVLFFWFVMFVARNALAILQILEFLHKLFSSVLVLCWDSPDI